MNDRPLVLYILLLRILTVYFVILCVFITVINTECSSSGIVCMDKLDSDCLYSGLVCIYNCCEYGMFTQWSCMYNLDSASGLVKLLWALTVSDSGGCGHGPHGQWLWPHYKQWALAWEWGKTGVLWWCTQCHYQNKTKTNHWILCWL